LLLFPLLLTAGSAQAGGILGAMSSPYFDACIDQVRAQNGYANMSGGWKKHVKDFQHRGQIYQCIRDTEARSLDQGSHSVEDES
jgi:hypothetical protein